MMKRSHRRPITAIAPLWYVSLAAKRDEQETLNSLKAEILARLNTP